MKKLKFIQVGIIIFIICSIFIFYTKLEKPIGFQGEITVFTEVGDLGQVVNSISIKYDKIVSDENIDTDTFVINYYDKKGPNTAKINKIYTSNLSDGLESDNGNYVIIDVEAFSGNDEYQITQYKDVYNPNSKFNEVKLEKENIKNVKTQIVDDFEKKTFIDNDLGISLNYRLFEPKVYDNKKYPLVLFLHGSGECGSDNEVQLLKYRGAIVFADKNNQEKNPCYVIAPQLPLEKQISYSSEGWNDPSYEAVLVDLIKDYVNNANVDVNRIYVTGLSMGGIGTWDLIEDNPDLFAAAIPICGQGDISKVSAIKELPIWAFHSENDTIVPVSGTFVLSQGENVKIVNGTRDVVDALKSAGSTKIKYTEYKKDSIEIKDLELAHMSWVPAYKNEEVITWLFAQKK